MTKSRLKLASVVALAVLAACATGNRKFLKGKTLDAVTLTLERQPTGRYKAIANPDHLVVYGYNPNAPDSEVTWVFRHKETSITFKDPRFKVEPCDQTCKKCTLTLPAGLAFHTQYKYTIRGKDNENVDLDPNDPDIEVYP